MTNSTGALSLAYMRGERTIKKDRHRRFSRVDMRDLTREEEQKIREEARRTGEPFQAVAVRILSKQKKLGDF